MSKKITKILIGVGILLVLIVGFFIVKGSIGTKETNKNLVISKSDLTSAAKFYSYKVGKTKMEVLALKASDGTVRTAFNTCQVCYSSGRGYYKLDGTTLVCQNCGNRFNPDQVELQKGGCNPVPIFDENKTENDSQIIISNDFLKQAEVIFENWKN